MLVKVATGPLPYHNSLRVLNHDSPTNIHILDFSRLVIHLHF